MTQEQINEMDNIKNAPDDSAEWPHARELIVYTMPHAKDRPRFAGTLPNGSPKVITPKATHDAEQIIADAWRKKYGNLPVYDRGHYLKLQASFYFPLRKSITATEFELLKHGRLRHTSKPDADNLLKLVLDALNGVAYTDDSAVVEIAAWKFYSAREPRVAIRISEV